MPCVHYCSSAESVPLGLHDSRPLPPFTACQAVQHPGQERNTQENRHVSHARCLVSYTFEQHIPSLTRKLQYHTVERQVQLLVAIRQCYNTSCWETAE